MWSGRSCDASLFHQGHGLQDKATCGTVCPKSMDEFPIAHRDISCPWGHWSCLLTHAPFQKMRGITADLIYNLSDLIEAEMSMRAELPLLGCALFASKPHSWCFSLRNHSVTAGTVHSSTRKRIYADSMINGINVVFSSALVANKIQA